MNPKISPILSYKLVSFVCAFIAGAALPFAFAPANLYLLAIISPAILLALWINKTPKQAFWLGLIFGIGFFGLGVSWVYISIHIFGDTSAVVAVFLTALFIAILAIYPALQGYLLARFFPNNTPTKFCLAFPASWVLLEWIRGWLFSGFPWLYLGASQTNSLLRGFAPVVGEFGLSFLVTLCAGLVVTLFFYGWRQSYKSILIIISIWLLGAGLAQIQWTQLKGVPFTATLVQANIPQHVKWSQNYLVPTLDLYIKLTKPHWSSALIVWPEAAIPAFLHQVQPFVDDLRIHAAENYTTLLLGIPIEKDFNFYNSLLLLHNNQQQVYYKRHLVIFGEYVPFDRWLRGIIGILNIPMSDFSAGPDDQPSLHFNNIFLAPFICYEIAYQQEVLPEFPEANFIVVVSNDAWFGNSFATAQHLQIGQLRALETGRYLLFTNNNGLTSFIDAQGNIRASLPINETGTLTNAVQPMTGSTPIVWLGSHLIIITLVLFLLLAYGLQRVSVK